MRLLSSGPDDPMNGLVHDERPVFPTIARQPYILPNGNEEPEPPQTFDVLALARRYWLLLFLFLILWFVRTRTRTPNGLLTGLFMICYSVFRIVVEYYREPDAPLIGMFTRGQFFSFFVIAIGIAFIVVAKRRPSYPRKLTR